MASIEAEDLETQQENVENNIQPFFVLHKASSQKKGRKLGEKNRRKIEIKESEAMAAEAGESEEQLFEDLRMEAFDIVWSKTLSTIKDVLRKINLDVFTEIDQWVHKSFDAIFSQGRPDYAKITCSYPIVTDTKSKQLFTGLVFTTSWYAEKRNYENPVVVIIEDLERCCGTVLSDFILMLRYTLAQEHGDLINLHDWYKSFKATICTTNKGSYKLKQSPSKKRKHAIEPQLKSEASLQARFCRAVMELQITGLLRMPSKKRPDYVQLVAFGL